MRKSRFNEEQIIGILKESEAGVATPELCRVNTGSRRRRCTGGRGSTAGWGSERGEAVAGANLSILAEKANQIGVVASLRAKLIDFCLRGRKLEAVDELFDLFQLGFNACLSFSCAHHMLQNPV